MSTIRRFITLIILVFAVGTLSASEREVVTTHVPVSDPWQTTPTRELPSRPHPRLFVSKDDLKAAKAKAAQYSWAGQIYEKLISKANEALARPLEIPSMAGEWSHHYVCKTCGIRLEDRKGKNVCPRCKREYSGWPYDGVVASLKHHKNIDDARVLGLAWQLEGKQAYADKCRLILLAYAEKYPSFPIHDYKGGQDIKGAKLFAQTLDESVRMIPFVWAYDLVYDSPSLAPADKKLVEDNLFRQAAATIRRNDMGVSNWQTWHNAAIASIGYVLGDAGMVNHAIDGKSGINYQLRSSVLPDGFWYEGAASYHFYALQAMQWQVLAMKQAGSELYKNPTYRSLYQAPLDYSLPDGTFPAVNDSDPISIVSQAEHYEVAFAFYGEPQYAELARLGGRNSEAAWLFGAATLPASTPAVPTSHNFPGLGATILRQGNTSNPLALHIDYGPHGGAHGHFDKLGIIFFANGSDVVPDPGRLAYGAPMHNKWYKTSVAHNTVIVDGQNQSPADGRLVSSHFDGPVQMVTAACGGAYKDVQLTRSLALAPEYLLDTTSGKSGTSHTWDLAYHINGTVKSAYPQPAPRTLGQRKDGYQVLQNVRQAKTSGQLDIQFSGAGKTKDDLRLRQVQPSDGELILAEGVTGSNVTTCPAVLCRQTGDAVQWITLIVPGNRTDIDWAVHEDEGGCLIKVTVAGREDRYLITNGELKSL